MATSSGGTGSTLSSVSPTSSRGFTSLSSDASSTASATVASSGFSSSTSISPTRSATPPAHHAKLKRVYKGHSFFEGFQFQIITDLSEGSVSYVDEAYAYKHKLAEVTRHGSVIRTVDRWSELQPNISRDLVRLESNEVYVAGHLMFFDSKHMPIGCGTWYVYPGVRTSSQSILMPLSNLGRRQFALPDLGDSTLSKVPTTGGTIRMALHTTEGCTRNASVPQTGNSTAPWASDNCYAYSSSYGCQTMDWDPRSYGESFNKAGGGVFAMLFGETGISFWRWSRHDIPLDVRLGRPNWTTWGTPVGAFDGSTCDTKTFFKQQIITLASRTTELPLCGTWAGIDSVWQDPIESGNYYSKYPTCADAVQDPKA
ncbi:hypothetical protein JCM11641_002829 [Rhodosporidiobolus odoratus]